MRREADPRACRRQAAGPMRFEPGTGSPDRSGAGLRRNGRELEWPRPVWRGRAWREAVDRVQKREMVEDLGQIFASAGSVVVAHYSGLTVAEISELRTRMRDAGAKFKVAKNRLAKIALENTDRGAAADLFVGPTGIAYADDPVTAPKVATQYAKDNAKLVIIGGLIGEARIDAKAVDDLARMPSLDELRSKLLGTLSAPAAMLARTLAAPGTKLARTLAAPGASLVGVLNAKVAKEEAA